MFENKYLVNIYVLSLGISYEVYLPANEKVGNIAKLLDSSLYENNNDNTKLSTIMNSETGQLYSNNTIIRNTDIKNGSMLLLI